MVPRESGGFPGIRNINFRRRGGSPGNIKRNYVSLNVKHERPSYTISLRLSEILPGEPLGFGIDASIHIHSTHSYIDSSWSNLDLNLV